MAKILVIDDDPDILVVMEIILNMKGFTPEVTSDWDTIFERVEAFQPDLIVLDILIAGNDGRTICKQLKADPKTKEIPVIMLSAHSAAAATIKEYGADDFIAKPFQVNDLVEKINRHLKK
ncbi:N/A [soil metagenome]